VEDNTAIAAGVIGGGAGIGLGTILLILLVAYMLGALHTEAKHAADGSTRTSCSFVAQVRRNCRRGIGSGPTVASVRE